MCVWLLVLMRPELLELSVSLQLCHAYFCTHTNTLHAQDVGCSYRWKCCALFLKGTAHAEMKILSLFIHILDPCGFLLTYGRKYFIFILKKSLMAAKITADTFCVLVVHPNVIMIYSFTHPVLIMSL